MAVARTTEIGSIAVIPSPSAVLTEPTAASTVGPVFPVKAEPSDRCASARYEWRRTTNDSWTVGATLAASNLFAATIRRCNALTVLAKAWPWRCRA